MARSEVIDPHEVAIVHVHNRTVRRCFLMGDDAVSGKNFNHRKVWIEQYLQQFAAEFGIDLLSFAILSNHFHLILRSRPDVVATWDDREVARSRKKGPGALKARLATTDLSQITKTPPGDFSAPVEIAAGSCILDSLTKQLPTRRHTITNLDLALRA